MSEMVDRVAAALRTACLKQFGKTWADDTARQFALAAIQTMREPTPEMIDAGSEAMPGEPAQGGSLPGNPVTPWKAMIDEALKP